LPGKTRLRYDLLCVEWNVKPYTLTHSLTIQHRVVLVIFLLNLQTITITQMLSSACCLCSHRV